MKNGGKKLLAGVLAAAAAWSLGSLALELGQAGRQNADLREAAAEVRQENRELEQSREKTRDRETAERELRQQGYIAPGDQVFFDGG